jgi:hypothetical protein
MDKRELRIGNWIQIVNPNKPEEIAYGTITQLQNFCAIVKNNNKEIAVGYKLIKPIEITNDLLINKLNFEPDEILGKLGYLENKKLRITTIGIINITENGYCLDGWNVHIDDEDFITCYANDLKYVHQLQNAYFSVTDNEIQIKL